MLGKEPGGAGGDQDSAMHTVGGAVKEEGHCDMEAHSKSTKFKSNWEEFWQEKRWVEVKVSSAPAVPGAGVLRDVDALALNWNMEKYAIASTRAEALEMVSAPAASTEMCSPKSVAVSTDGSSSFSSAEKSDHKAEEQTNAMDGNADSAAFELSSTTGPPSQVNWLAAPSSDTTGKGNYGGLDACTRCESSHLSAAPP
jgi:hypothetical protein